MKQEKMIIYQVLPRLFGNTKTGNIANGNIGENGCGKLSAFSSGALQKIKSMGFTHIWYTGLLEHATQTDYSAYGISRDHPVIVKGKAGSPYAVKDYYDIDPDLADDVSARMDEFNALVQRMHDAGLKMIMDFVPNHVAREYRSDAKPEGVADFGEKDNIHTTYDKNNNFYYIPGQKFSPQFSLEYSGETYEEFPAKATGNDCFSACPTQNDWYETVKLNYGIDYLNGRQTHFDPVPDSWYKMRDILLFWAAKDVDGFRCDMAEMVPVEFWNWVVSIIKEQYPTVSFIGEVYNPEEYRNYLQNGKFDYLYDKVGLYDTLRAITTGEKAAHEITYCWQSVNDIQDRMLNFLENHDEQRIASDFFAGDPWKAIPALVVSTMMNTNPVMIYFGQELGERGMEAEGFSGLDGKTSIFDYWSIESLRNWYNGGKVNDDLLTADQKSLRNFYVKLLTICNSSEAIIHGKFYDLMYVNPATPYFNPDKQFAFMRKAKHELLLIIANFDDKDVDIHVFIPAHAFDYFEIEPQNIGGAKELLSGKKVPSALRPDSNYVIDIKKYSAMIIKFSLKKTMRNNPLL